MNSPQRIIVHGSSNNQALAELGRQLPAPTDRIDLAGNLTFFRRRLGLIVAITAIAVLAASILTFLQDKTYTSTATVNLVAPASVQDVGPGAAGDDLNSAYVDTQVEILESREMATRVANSLGLLSGLAESERRDLIDGLQAGIDAERSGESYALLLTFQGDSAAGSALRVNEFAQQFVDWEISNTRDRTSTSIESIEQRLAELRANAQQDTAALQQYRIANNLLSTSGSSLTEQEISSYNQAVTQARAQVAEDEARLATALSQINQGSSGDDVGEALNSPVVSSLRSQEAQLAGEVASLSSRYGPNHPELIRVSGQLAQIRQQIDAEINRVVSNLRAKADVSRQRLASLSSSLGSARSQLSRNNAAMVGLEELERNAQVSQGLYETYLENYQQLIASEGTESPNARIISLAEPPLMPSSPSIPLNLALAVIIGFGTGIVVAYVVDTMSRGMVGAQQVEAELGERYLGAIPLLSSVTKGRANPATALAQNSRSVFSESFRGLATSIDQSMMGPAQTVAVASALPQEGKTVTAICLAQTYAMAGKKTLLVDCDEICRGVSQMLDLASDHPGLIEMLNGDAALDDVLVGSSAGLSVLPIAKSENPTPSQLVGPYMDELLRGLRDRFDHIVLDLPPVLPVAASRRLAEKADAVTFVVRWSKTSADAARAALKLLPHDRINLAGVVLTQVDMRRNALFGRNDPGFYYSQYQSYYG